MKIDGIQQGSTLERLDLHGKIATDNQVPSFKETLTGFLNDVNTSQKVASEAQAKFLAGEVTDVHQVTGKSEEAKVAFNMLMELRNKSLEGFQEAMRIKV